jgi:hypothetical protein
MFDADVIASHHLGQLLQLILWFIRILFFKAKQGRLPKQSFQKTGEHRACDVVGAVVARMTFLAQAAQ